MQVNHPADLRAILKLVLEPKEIIDVFEVCFRPFIQSNLPFLLSVFCCVITALFFIQISGRTARTVGNEEETGLDVAGGGKLRY